MGLTIKLPHISVSLLAALLTGILLAVSIVRIEQTPSVLYWDQSYLQYTFQDPYPIPEQGFPQFWIAGMIQSGGRLPDIQLNTAIRMLAAALYLLSAGLLGWSIRGKGGLPGFSLWMFLIFTSGMQFLWLSSELLAGAFLMLFLWGLTKAYPVEVEILFLVLLGLTKPDLFFVALLVCAYLSFHGKGKLRTKLLRLDLFLALSALAWLPGLIQNGLGYIQADGRSLNSLGQHYAALISPLQVTQGLPDPWANYGLYVAPTWGTANSLFSLILSNPARYMDFLFLSMATSLRRLAQGLLLFYLPLAVLVFHHWRDREKKVFVLLFLCNLVPIFMLAFYHVRYGARFLPLVLYTIFAGLDAVDTPRLRWITQVGMAFLLVIQVIVFGQAFSAGYWLVD